MVNIGTVKGGFRWSKLWIVCVLVGLSITFLSDLLLAKPLYSYRDAQGMNVITDNYERIPEQYRMKVTTVEQETDWASQSAEISGGVAGLLKRADNHIGNATISVPGLSPYQSHALTITGSLALLCLLLRGFSRSQVIRFLTLWGLVMLGLVTPVFIYFSQDGPLDILRGQASHIQTKQSEHLKQVQ
jgi:hypothetical protein